MHRIQYFVNLLDEMQKRSKLDVFALYAFETAGMTDLRFQRNITWDNRPATVCRTVSEALRTGWCALPVRCRFHAETSQRLLMQCIVWQRTKHYATGWLRPRFPGRQHKPSRCSRK